MHVLGVVRVVLVPREHIDLIELQTFLELEVRVSTHVVIDSVTRS